MRIVKSKGYTSTEKLLATLCEKSFLKLWSYPNPVKNDGHEFCDLLAVFENHVFIFFDRKKTLEFPTGKDPLILWNRWKSKVIDAQIRTAHGAERYLRSGGALFLDSKREAPFPLNVDVDTMVVHKIVVAHGAKEACERFSNANVHGSLGISYGDLDPDEPFPFVVSLDKTKPVHIFDSHNLPIILSELDTFYDFSRFLDAKVEAISKHQWLAYCGEEDLLAFYFQNYNKDEKRYFIGIKDENFSGILIEEGAWESFIESDAYKNKKNADQVSYFWDQLIQHTCENALEGTLLGNSDLFRGKSAIIEMAKEPRFMRRALSQKMLESVNRFPEADGMMRNVNLMPSFYPNKAYVFLQLKATPELRKETEYREVRAKMLEVACGAAKVRDDNLETVIGIGVEAPKYHDEISEDFILLDCSNWPKSERRKYEEMNKVMGFFTSPSMTLHHDRVSDFPQKP